MKNKLIYQKVVKGEKEIFNVHLANRLLEKGIPMLRIVMNKKVSSKFLFIFPDTEELKVAMNQINEEVAKEKEQYRKSTENSVEEETKETLVKKEEKEKE